MKTISLTVNHNDFFCPMTGQRILGPEGYKRSPALIGVWWYDNILEPDIHDIELMAEWETFQKDRSHFQMDEFWAYVQKEDWATFILTNKGQGCTETVTIAYVFDASYSLTLEKEQQKVAQHKISMTNKPYTVNPENKPAALGFESIEHAEVILLAYRKAKTKQEYPGRYLWSQATSSCLTARAYWMLHDQGCFHEACTLARTILEREIKSHYAGTEENYRRIIKSEGNDAIKHIELLECAEENKEVKDGLTARRKEIEEFIGKIPEKNAPDLREMAKQVGIESLYISLYKDLCKFTHGSYENNHEHEKGVSGPTDYTVIIAPIRIAYLLLKSWEVAPEQQGWKTKEIQKLETGMMNLLRKAAEICLNATEQEIAVKIPQIQ